MHTRRTVVIVAATLLIAQILAIAHWHGTGVAARVSDLLQICFGILCLIACLHARSASGNASCHHWTWLAVSFVGFVLAQGIATYIDASSNQSLERLDDILFSLSVMPTAMLPFLDPDREHSRLDRLHVLDFVQVFCFWASLYLYFANAPSLALATVGWEGFGWTSSIVYHLVLTLSFVLRVAFGKSKGARWFFGGMACYVLLAGLADAYASLPANGVEPGHWFDLIWSLLLALPLLIAVMSHQDLSLSPQADQAERVISNHLFPLVYPFFSILFLVQDARRVPTMSSVLAMVVFAALAVRILIIQQRLSRAQQTLQFEASHDTLTGACNRAAIMDTLSKEIIRHARTQEPLGLMLADIDHFKAVNDKHGHAVGDQVLAAVVRQITESVRAVDSVGRYGGEEFLIVLPNCDSSGAVAVAERCRGAMADCPVQTSAGPICVSISIGVFSTTEAMPSGQSTLLRLADRALYDAKASGRNCVKQADAILCTDLC